MPFGGGGGGGGGGTITTKNGAQLALGVAQAFTTSVGAAISWTSATFDTGAYTNIAGHPTRLTITNPGLYILYGYVEWAANNTGVREADIRRNGAAPPNYGLENLANAGSGAVAPVTILFMGQCAAADYFECFGFQNSGGNLNVNTTSIFSISFLGA